MDSLDNYRQLVARVNELCCHITDKLLNYIVCRPGCNTCCKHLTIFPVEGAAIAHHLKTLPQDEVDRIRRLVTSRMTDVQCPLQENGLCLLYDVRPLICRTHGLPIITASNGKAHVDFCPMNFTGVDSLSGSAVINLDTLNTSLTAVNAVFLAQNPSGEFSGIDRLTIAEAVLLDF